MSQKMPNLLYLNEDDEKAETAGVDGEDEEELEYDKSAKYANIQS